jgi:uncharacterized membrane protein
MWILLLIAVGIIFPVITIIIYPIMIASKETPGYRIQSGMGFFAQTIVIYIVFYALNYYVFLYIVDHQLLISVFDSDRLSLALAMLLRIIINSFAISAIIKLSNSQKLGSVGCIAYSVMVSVSICAVSQTMVFVRALA